MWVLTVAGWISLRDIMIGLLRSFKAGLGIALLL